MKIALSFFAVFLSLNFAYAKKFIIENKGQVVTHDLKSVAGLSYYYSDRQNSVFFFKDRVEYLLTSCEATGKDAGMHTKVSQRKVVLHFVNSNSDAAAAGLQCQKGALNYFTNGNSVTGVHHFKTVSYTNIYNGVDLEYTVTDAGLKYNFIVHPFADPSQIKIAYSGAIERQQLEGGALITETQVGQLTDHKPVSMQNGKIIETNYAMNGNKLTFVIGAYDKSKQLTIDPLVLFTSSYMGGDKEDIFNEVFLKSPTELFLSGTTSSVAYPVQDAFDSTYNGTVDNDICITKTDPTTNVLYYSTYIGGNDNEAVEGMAVDTNGFVMIAGQTASSNYPVTSGVIGTTYSGTLDGCITRLDSSGGSLNFSTFFGGNGVDRINAIHYDFLGQPIFGGFTFSSDLPVANAYDSSANGGMDGFVARMNITGTALLYSSYIGGTSLDEVNDVAATFPVTGAPPSIIYAGRTISNDLPLANALYSINNGGGGDVMIGIQNTATATLEYSTYYGGTAVERVTAFTLFNDSILAITGYTGSSDFPYVSPFQTYSGVVDGYIIKMNPFTNIVTFSTCIGGPNEDIATDIEQDDMGGIHISGYSLSPGLPVYNFYDSVYGGNAKEDIFLASFDNSNSLQYLSYLGDTANEVALGISVLSGLSSHSIALCGYATGAGYPIITPYDSSFNGVTDGVYAIFLFSNTISIGIKDQSKEATSVLASLGADKYDLIIKDGCYQNKSYKLMDMAGKVIAAAKLAQSRTRVSLSELPHGNYIIFLTNENDQSRQYFKLVKF